MICMNYGRLQIVFFERKKTELRLITFAVIFQTHVFVYIQIRAIYVLQDHHTSEHAFPTCFYFDAVSSLHLITLLLMRYYEYCSSSSNRRFVASRAIIKNAFYSRVFVVV